VRFSPSVTGDYGVVVSTNTSSSSDYADEPFWDSYCFIYSTSAFDPSKPLVDFLRGNDDLPGGVGVASGGKCGFPSGLALSAGKAYTLVVSSYSRASEGSWEAEVVAGPGRFVLLPKPASLVASSSSSEIAAALAPSPSIGAAAASSAATAGAGAPSPLTSAEGNKEEEEEDIISSQRWNWVAPGEAASPAESAKEKEEVSALFADEKKKNE